MDPAGMLIPIPNQIRPAMRTAALRVLDLEALFLAHPSRINNIIVRNEQHGV
jgi:hypothetical protein